MRAKQTGTAIVEFAIIASVMLMILFGVIEFGRVMFVGNALAESTRRGARLAAVCPVGDPMPAQAAVLAGADGVSLIDADLTVANVSIAYLDVNGAPVANPAVNLAAIRYVRTSIVDYQQQMLIPFIMPSFLMPSFVATLPAESLGYGPTPQAFVPC
ncbi:MAG TPA: TadE/TadG family type IV pilus assembly protein [Steroidobacteraceae bacterium]|jgi:Flp pilus assembly protein TadG|nr:TadE/TadG family type IV pilus assembly protein [Steroidobacteraceae bacterium]